MARRYLKKLTIVFLCLAISLPAFAQEQKEERKLSGTRKQLAIIVFSGLGGAVLGLSTLSFYGRPQDYLSNIAIGFALGVIGGAVFTTYNATQDPKKFHGEEEAAGAMIQEAPNWQQARAPIFQYQWQF